MKNNKISVYISCFSMILFLLSASVCYFKIRDNLKNETYDLSSVIILNFTKEKTELYVDPIDMLSPSKDAVATAETTLDVIYTNSKEIPFSFDLVMEHYGNYTKTKGVDGINFFEYTYEILCDDKIIVSETEIESYVKDKQTILLSEKIMPSKQKKQYKIIFRFYANEFDQDHLMGTSLDSKLIVIPKS